MATRGLPFYWRCICVYLLKRKTSTLPFQQNVLFSNLGARTAARALQIYDLLKRKSFFDIYMKQTFYLKQTLLKQKWSEISHRIWKVLSFFMRVFTRSMLYKKQSILTSSPRFLWFLEISLVSFLIRFLWFLKISLVYLVSAFLSSCKKSMHI